MLAKKIIPRIDLDHGKCASVLDRLSDPRDAVEACVYYMQQGADEIYLFDAFPSPESHRMTCQTVRLVAEAVNLPIMVGGSILAQEQIADLLDCGADKVVIGSIAARQPSFISAACRAFSSPRICVRIDTDRTNWGYRVLIGGPTDIPRRAGKTDGYRSSRLGATRAGARRGRSAALQPAFRAHRRRI